MPLGGEEFGKRLRRAREAAGVSQSALAARLSIEAGGDYISKVERGKKGLEDAKVDLAAKALGVRMEELTGETERRAPLKARAVIAALENPDAWARAGGTEGPASLADRIAWALEKMQRERWDALNRQELSSYVADLIEAKGRVTG